MWIFFLPVAVLTHKKTKTCTGRRLELPWPWHLWLVVAPSPPRSRPRSMVLLHSFFTEHNDYYSKAMTWRYHNDGVYHKYVHKVKSTCQKKWTNILSWKLSVVLPWAALTVNVIDQHAIDIEFRNKTKCDITYKVHIRTNVIFSTTEFERQFISLKDTLCSI